MTAKPDVARAPSYWHFVWLEFRKHRIAIVGLVFTALLGGVALLTPFLAQSMPFIWRAADGSWSSPFFRDYFRISIVTPEKTLEKAFNWLTLFLLCAGILHLVIRHRLTQTSRRIIMLTMGGLLLIPFITMRPVNDPTPYRALAATNEGWGIFPLIPYSPFEVGFGEKRPPTWCEHTETKLRSWHLFGTDNVGRDVFTRMLHGTRVALAVGIVSVAISTIIGILMGAMAGYFGGWTDLLISRFVEIMMCFPTFFLILTIIAIVDQRSILNIILIIGFTGWTGIARLTRGEVLKQRSLDYVAAAQAMGVNNTRIITRHILPNALAPVLVSLSFMIAGSILTESGLSFLGFGVDIPTASWGEMLNEAREAPLLRWWLAVFPGIAIFITVTLYNLVGEALRDAMDPRLRGERP